MGDNGGKVWDIYERSRQYALRAVRLFQALESKKEGAGRILGKQYLRAATSIGANLVEAKAVESRPEFVHKLGIVQKEARESLHWLGLIRDAALLKDALLNDIIRETEELVSVITAILVKSKRNRAAGQS